MLTQLYQDNPLFFILLALLGLVLLIQLGYFLLIYLRPSLYKQKNDFVRKDEPVSIIVCARNEYKNLRDNLPRLFEQDYSHFEVVVVDHGSEDDTPYLLRDLKEVYTNLKIVTMPEDKNFFTGKKFPLSIGIKSASYELLLFTDADCIPRSNQWLRRMASNFTEGKSIVLGYGAYQAGKGLLNRFIRFDTLRVAMQYFGFALIGSPYMGVGRNMAYRKSLFYQHNGFISHYRVLSGDDDLFINRAATRKNTRIELRPESHTISEPKHSFSEWYRQKKRHLESGVHYKFRHKLFLGIFGFTQFLFFALTAVLLSFLYMPYMVAGAFGLRLFVQLIVYGRTMRKLREKGFLLLVPLFELFLLLIQPVLSASNLFSKTGQWR